MSAHRVELRTELKAWYRQAMAGRIEELQGHRRGLAEGDPGACDAARAVGQALRGSGATFGFPELTEVAALVENAPDSVLLRRVEGLISYLQSFRAADGNEARCHAEWLALAAGLEEHDGEGFSDLGGAWAEVSRAAGLEAGRLAERVAERLGLESSGLGAPSRSALRLVPEALMRRGPVLPLVEDAETITVATGDPTSLTMELELLRLTGRAPVFAVAPPEEIERALSAVVDAALPGAASRTGRAATQREDGSDRVLIVDDDASSRLLARSVLEKHGYEVVEADDGLDALDRLRVEQPVSVVVADLNMPRMDGLELIWEIRGSEDWTHIPVIVVTGETDEVLEAKLIEEGADDYIRKPMDPRLFTARVGATIRRAEA